MLNIKKSIVVITILVLALASLSAMQVSTCFIGNCLIDDTTQAIYIGGELRMSFLNHVKPFVGAGFSAGVIKDKNDTATSTAVSNNRRSFVNTYLNTLKLGVEYRANLMNNFSCGIAVYGLAYDKIIDVYKDGMKKSEHTLKAGVGAEISAIVPFRLTNKYVINSTTSACTFRISGAYTFDKTINIGASVGVIFKFNSAEA